MEAENARLRRQLSRLLETVRDNEHTLARFNARELKLIAAGSLNALLEQLLLVLPGEFELDALSVKLFHTSPEDRLIFEFDGLGERYTNGLLIAGTPSAVPDEAWLGEYVPSMHAELFPQLQGFSGSVAILPLYQQGEVVGTLNLASVNPDRYHSASGTFFLNRLTAVVAVCLENALNRERLRHAGLTDPLTGVRNRRYFDQRLREEYARALRQGRPLSCLFIDIDHFKVINDTHGHPVGDEVLQQVATRIGAQLRTSDILARYGGEEFVALLPDTDLLAAKTTAERICRIVAGGAVVSEASARVPVTVSVGVADLDRIDTGQGELVAIAELLRRADAAMYAAKQEGRNRLCISRG